MGVDKTSKQKTWSKVVVVDLNRAKDGQVRSAVVRTPEGFVTRRAVKLIKLDIGRDGNSRRGHLGGLRGGDVKRRTMQPQSNGPI